MDKPPTLDTELSLTLRYIMENPELLNAPEQDPDSDSRSKEKKLEDDMPDLSSAYLGPQLWDNMLLSDDLKMEPVEVEEIMCNNNVNADVSDLAMLMESAVYSPNQPVTHQQPAPVYENESPPKSDVAKEKALEDQIPDLSSAFLGPQLWNNMLLSDDLKLEPVEMKDMLNDSNNMCNDGDLAMLMQSARYSPISNNSDESSRMPKTPTQTNQVLNNGGFQQQPSNNVRQYQSHSPINQQPPNFMQGGDFHAANNVYNSNVHHSTSAPQLYGNNTLGKTSPVPSHSQPSLLAPPQSPDNFVSSPGNPKNMKLSPNVSPVRIPSPANCDFQPSEADLLIATPKPENGDVLSMQIYNPKTRQFQDDELKPQPIIRKAKKLYVDEESKDKKYWARRQKNNMAAKRSREARRIKENQIALRASFLEKENQSMKTEIASLRNELDKLLKLVKSYEERFRC